MSDEQPAKPLRIAICLDTWKLSIFRRHLKRAGLKYEKYPGVTTDTITLIVVHHSMEFITPIVKAANTEAAKVRTQHGN